HKVARSRSARVNIAVRYGEPAKDRLDCGDRFALPADHKTAAGEGAMRSTGRSHIDEMQSALSHASMTSNRGSPIGVPAVGDDVPRFEHFAQLVQQSINKGAGGDIEHCKTRARQRLEVCQCCRYHA